MAELVVVLYSHVIRASATCAVATAAITLAGAAIVIAWLFCRPRVPAARTVRLSSGVVVRI